MRDAFLGRAVAGPRLHDQRDSGPDAGGPASRGRDAHWDIGREFGTIGARRGEHTVEVTSYRADAYDGQTRKPVVAFGDNLEDDLVRRDFTVNAMALRLPSMEFVDPYAGLADLAARRLRTPGPPEVSFGDDPLRMMRACRFVAQLGVEVAPEVRAAMRAMAALDRDRVGRAGPRRADQAAARADQPRAGPAAAGRHPGWPTTCCPSCRRCELEVDEHHRHKDVYEHSLTVLDQAIALEGPADGPESSVPGPDLVLRLAALLHDIGKPATRRFEAGGGVLLPPPRGGRRQAHRQAAQGAALRQGHRQGGGPAGRAAPAVPRVRRRGSGPTRRCAATSPTPGRCSSGCTG